MSQRKREAGRVKGKSVKKERCVNFLSGLLGGSRQWIFSEASPCCTSPFHCKVCENSTHKELREEKRKAER